MPARALFLALTLAACGGSQHSTPPATTEAPPAAPATESPVVDDAASNAIPDSPAGRQLGWVLELLNDRAGVVDEAALSAHFAPSFLGEVPAEKLIPLMAQLATMGPFALEDIDAADDGNELTARVTTKAGPFEIHLGVVEDGAIGGLLLRPAATPGPELSSIAEVEAALTPLAPKVGFLIAELEGKDLTPIAEHDADAQLAIGSTFKLYVLAALADRIAAGKLAWDRPLEIREAWKSLPSGTLQDREAGTKLPVREVAEKMISISDNTATDLLIRAVGRARVEAALARAKHSEPARNVPFYTTRELFILKMSLTDAERAAFIELPPRKRRKKLEGPIAKRPLPKLEDAASWLAPRAIDELEWFASAADLGRVLAALRTRADQPAGAPLLDILGKNPGLKLDGEAWTYVGYKGGSEPGVLNMSWLLRRADDRWFVASFTFNDTTAALDDGKIMGVVESALTALAAHDR